MPARLMGIETEYAIAAPARGPLRCSPAVLGSALIGMACKRMSHVFGAGAQNMFLPNGARLYMDCGRHVEFCTPEVDNPGDCVRYVLAGEAILRDLAMELRETMASASTLTLSRINVDYQPGVTWGCHENYLHRANPASLPRQLIPHLVTRIYACAGGLNPYSPGIEFSLSPRLHVFSESMRECTISDGEIPHVRGIYNPRSESLCSGGFHRLHVVCADSVGSQQALWLRVASTCLVLAMAEAGLNPGSDIALRKPVAALQAYLTDPHFRATAQLKTGQRVTALEVQRHYLRRAEAFLEHSCMPPWAPLVCERWRVMLDRLEQGPDAVAATLDWGLKRVLFMDHIRRRGFDPAALTHWNYVLARVRSADLRHGGKYPLGAVQIVDSPSYRQERRRLEPYMREHDLSWEQLRPLLELRSELCEIDWRIGQVAPQGVFDRLEPLLNHRVPGIDKIDEAKTTPPQRTRAQLRGRVIAKLAGKPGCLADWNWIADAQGRTLNLDNPSEEKARWETSGRTPLTGYVIGDLLNQAYAAYQEGDFEEALRVLKSHSNSWQRDFLLGVPLYISYLAWAECRAGYAERAIDLLNSYVESHGGDEDTARDYVVVYRFKGLAPLDPELGPWIQRGDDFVQRGCWSTMTVADFLGHKGFVLGRTGFPHEAANILRRSCEIEDVDNVLPRMRARVMGDLADVLRLLGQRDEATNWLERAEQIHRQHDFLGERADYVLLNRAKLESDPDRALATLKEAARIQKRLRNRVGLARNLLLQARLARDPVRKARLRWIVMRLRDQVPDLRTCPRLAHILEKWNAWAGGASDIENGDFFWLV